MNSCNNRPDRPAEISRAQGCLLGQLAGDVLGSLVEFQTPEQIRREYPGGVRDLADGGTWHTIAGQPTDDSEMALLLARMLVDQGIYSPEEARKVYVFWLDSGPFDCGMTVSSGLRGRPNPESQANGAMMRISPLGIFGANHDLEQVAEWARQDASLTHPHPVCRQANALFTTCSEPGGSRGGDTDTNAAICGTLLGAVWGRDAIPAQWTDCLLNCRPVAGQSHVTRPRPECFWPVDALELAKELVTTRNFDICEVRP